MSGEHLGANQPSPLDNPTRGSSSTGRRRTGVPSKYPNYLEPTPVNTRRVNDVMRAILNAREPRVQRLLYATWNAQRSAIKYQELRNAMRDGRMTAAQLDVLREQYAMLINEKLAPQWEAVALKASEVMGESMATSLGTLPTFPETRARIGLWVKEHGAELAVNLTTNTAEALRRTIEHYTATDSVGPDELARLLRPMIGLTPRQADAVRRFRDGLTASELTAKEVSQQVGNYAGYLHRVRAKRIARTELAFAFNQGTLEQVRELEASREVEGVILKEWYTAQDERVCAHCGPLHGQMVDLEETFPGGTRKVPNTFVPPAHPGCRCTIIYNVLS